MADQRPNESSAGFVRYITGWRFPTFLLSALFFLTLPVVVIMFIPGSDSGLGVFAREFKTWCFGYDAANGGIDWIYLAMTVLNPTILGAFVVAVWWKPLREGWRHHRRSMFRHASFAVLFVAGGALGILGLGPPPGAYDARPFPAGRLRTELEPPRISLVNQNERRTTLREHEGKVVLLTALYSSCQTMCPRIISRIKRALGSLSEEQRSKVVVLAVTLDPKRDTPPVLANLAERHGVGSPRYHFMTGDPEEVNRILDELSVSRTRNPKTGMIKHSSLFALVDAEGRIAYRLSLGKQKRRWLSVALGVLTDEIPGDAPPTRLGKGEVRRDE